MEHGPKSQDASLTKMLARLNGLYSAFGREGLKKESLVEIGLLLESKKLDRDSLRRARLSEEKKEQMSHLELEIRDLTAYIKGQISELSSLHYSLLHRFERGMQPEIKPEKQQNRDREVER
jgi:hypothetical protein